MVAAVEGAVEVVPMVEAVSAVEDTTARVEAASMVTEAGLAAEASAGPVVKVNSTEAARDSGGTGLTGTGIRTAIMET